MPEFKKRGEVSLNIVIIVLSLIIAVLILLFAYTSIRDSRQKQNHLVLLKFNEKLKSDIESISIYYGSADMQKYSLPSGFDEICFVDINRINISQYLSDYPLIQDSIESGVKKNVFLIDGNSIESSYIEGLQLLDPYYYCMKIKNKNVEWPVEGKGDGAVVKVLSREMCIKANNTPGGCSVAFEFLDPKYVDECRSRYNLC